MSKARLELSCVESDALDYDRFSCQGDRRAVNLEFSVMSSVSPFILCGGSGTRLWPLSREAFPKQFHKIAGDETLFQQACRRMT